MRPDGAPNEHLDEGTAHAWLDGALSPEESARIEAHIADCRDCAAVVAEARGLIAGASRIVGALDVVPGGVLPERVLPERATSGGRPVRRWGWTPRAAAAVLVLAAGTAVVMRSPSEQRRADVADSAIAAPPAAVPNVPAPNAAVPSEAPARRVASKLAAAQTTAAREERQRREIAQTQLAERRAEQTVAGGSASAGLAAAVAPAAPSASPAPLAATRAFGRSESPAGVVRGTVADARGAPLGGASIAVRGDASAHTMTDSAGRFVIADVPAGPAALTVRRVGFAPRTVTVDVRPADTARADVALDARALALAQTVVTGMDAAPSDRARRARIMPAAPVTGCYAVHTDSSLSLPARLRLANPPRPDARWTRTDAQLRVALGGADSTTLVLHETGDGWAGVAHATAPARTGAVRLERVADCTPP